MPWEKKKEDEKRATPAAGGVYSTVGGVACYRVKTSKDNMDQIDGFTFT